MYTKINYVLHRITLQYYISLHYTAVEQLIKSFNIDTFVTDT